MADLPVHTPATEHEPPSLPASPSPKRVRNIEPAANLSVACMLHLYTRTASLRIKMADRKCCSYSERRLGNSDPAISQSFRPPEQHNGIRSATSSTGSITRLAS